MGLQPSHLVGLCRSHLRPGEVQVLWVGLEDARENRDSLVREIHLARASTPIVAVPLRERLFLSANLVASDFCRLIQGCRGEFEAVAEAAKEEGVLVLILAREALRLPSVSSPVVLPDWFPVCGGREVAIRVRDYASNVSATLLNSEEARVEDMADLLFRLEYALVARMNAIALRSPGNLDSWTQLVSEVGAGGEKRGDVLAAYLRHLESVSDPRGYRPSAKYTKSLVAQMVRLVLKRSPDGLRKVAKGLRRALDLAEDMHYSHSPMLAVLLRPVGGLRGGDGAAHSILLTVYGAYQFTTGAAHAGDYPSFAVGLIRATSVDLRKGLQAARRDIEELEH